VRLLLALAAAVVLGPGSAWAKGEGVGVWMEGQVSEVRAKGAAIHLVLRGRFWFEQHRGTEPSVIEMRDATIPATLAQGKPFFAMVENWHGGALRKPGALMQILQAAAASGKPVKFELVNARLKFAPEGRIAVEAAEVIRATDHDLR
jgi:hypothetical protein